jgi:hypothetical protein
VAEAARPPHPNFWVAPPAALPAAAGANRAVWDLRSDPPPAFRHTFEINANPGRTPPSPEGPLVLPGVYTLRLTVDGRAYTRPVTVRPDPESPASAAALAAQHALQTRLVQALRTTWEAYRQAAALRVALAGEGSAGGSAAASAVAGPVAGTPTGAFLARLDTVAGTLDADRARGRTPGTPPPNFVGLNAAFAQQLNAQELGDLAPTPAMRAAYAKACRELRTVTARWTRLRDVELQALLRAEPRLRGRAPEGVGGAAAPPDC